MNPANIEHPAIEQAFRDSERVVRIQNFRIACVVAIIFMPAGASLDWLVYKDLAPHFFRLRIVCSLLLLLIWWFVKTGYGSRHYRFLGLILPALPSFFISWMIFETEGPNSPYYAGLNLVLLGAALILRWSFWDSAIVFMEVVGLYFGACLLSLSVKGTSYEGGILFNNSYFLIVTGIFVVIGSLYYNRLRYREFALRYQLDENRQQLETTNRKLLELDQLKSRFFANISHELRTPLTLLLAPLESLMHRFGQAFDEQTNDLLLAMHANGMRLLKLINDLLELVRLESGRLEVQPEPVSVPEFISSLLAAARQLATEKGIELSCQVAQDIGVAMLDRDKVEKILLNLTFNAIKFTPAQGLVHVSVRRDAGEIEFTIRDTGVGIAPAHLPHIFDRFYQADDSSRRKHQGAGIGLALVKELTDVMGGHVTVTSREHQGSTFQVFLPYVPANVSPAPGVPTASLPLAAGASASSPTNEEWLTNLYRRAEFFPARSAPEPVVPPVPSEAADARPRVLVADDEPDMLHFLTGQLSADYTVIVAADGEQAVEKALHYRPALVLLDMMMPQKDGLQVCRELREHTSTQKTPIILLTARADEQTKLAALSAGANDYLTKPFVSAELQARVRTQVTTALYEEQLARQNRDLEQALTKLKEAESELVQTEKLASLGRLSAGIIHEINNPLNFATTGPWAGVNLMALKVRFSKIFSTLPRSS